MGRKPKSASVAQVIQNGQGAARLRELMAEHHLGAREVNERLGRKHANPGIYQHRNGKLPISPKVAVMYGKLFGVPPEEFLGAAPIAASVPVAVSAVTAPRTRSAHLGATITIPLSMEVNRDGTGRIRADITLPLDRAFTVWSQLGELREFFMPEDDTPPETEEAE